MAPGGGGGEEGGWGGKGGGLVRQNACKTVRAFMQLDALRQPEPKASAKSLQLKAYIPGG